MLEVGNLSTWYSNKPGARVKNMTCGIKPNQQLSTQSELSAYEPWQKRILVEKNELNEKIVKLAGFLSTEQFGSLHEDEQDRLTRQLEAMTSYRSILTERITAWNPPPMIQGDSGSTLGPTELVVEQPTEVAVEALPDPGTV